MGGAALVGTSGWSYRHWRGTFYPERIADRELLAWYAGRLGTVEINNSFYMLPGEAAVRSWRDASPSSFVFAVKASRLLTHMKKLRDPEPALANFLDRMEGLGRKLGPILFQLPPRWRVDPERLAAFLAALPPRRRFAFEFRDPTWFEPRVLELLRRRGCAFCIWELAGVRSPREVTADFVYLRLHGPDGPYAGSYDREALAGWAEAIGVWRDEGRDVYCYFDNDQAGHAANNAVSLREMVGG